MAIFTKHPLSGSREGLPITVTATAAAGAIEIHTVQATVTNGLELITLWTAHSATSAATPTLANFTVTNGADSADTYMLLPAQVNSPPGVQRVFSQLPMTGTGTIVHAFSTATETFFVWGYVDRIATAT